MPEAWLQWGPGKGSPWALTPRNDRRFVSLKLPSGRTLPCWALGISSHQVQNCWANIGLDLEMDGKITMVLMHISEGDNSQITLKVHGICGKSLLVRS